jgi:hypothetical protein
VAIQNFIWFVTKFGLLLSCIKIAMSASKIRQMKQLLSNAGHQSDKTKRNMVCDKVWAYFVLCQEQ